MLVFLFCCLVCLRPELTVLFYLTQIHHVDQTRLENRVLSTYFSQVLGIRYTATVRFKLLYFLLWSIDNQSPLCTSPRKRGNAWTLLWGFCTGTECCKIAAVWFLWLRIVCCNLSCSSLGFLDKLMCKCLRFVWMNLTSHRIKWNPQREKENLHEMFYLLHVCPFGRYKASLLLVMITSEPH